MIDLLWLIQANVKTKIANALVKWLVYSFYKINSTAKYNIFFFNPFVLTNFIWINHYFDYCCVCIYFIPFASCCVCSSGSWNVFQPIALNSFLFIFHLISTSGSATYRTKKGGKEKKALLITLFSIITRMELNWCSVFVHCCLCWRCCNHRHHHRRRRRHLQLYCWSLSLSLPIFMCFISLSILLYDFAQSVANS